MPLYFYYNTIHVTTAAFNTYIEMQVVFVQLHFLLEMQLFIKEIKKPLQLMNKNKLKKKKGATAFREIEGLSQKSLKKTRSFKHNI